MGREHKTFLPMIGTNSAISSLDEYNYSLFTDPLGFVNVSLPTGHTLGGFSANQYGVSYESLDTLYDSYCNNSGGCGEIKEETLNMTKDEVYSKMSLDNILLDVPQPLHHVVTHPLSVIDQNQFLSYEKEESVSNVYSYGAEFFAQSSGNQIVAPSDIAPRFPIGHAYYEEHALYYSQTSPQPWLRAESGGGYGKKIGDYYARVSLEKHRIYGCIQRNVWHAGAMLKYTPTERMLFDLHLCGWWDGWTPCIGVHNTGVLPFCFHTCTWNFWKVMFEATLLAVGTYVVDWIGNAVASFVASSGLGLLTATPAVPPPP